MSRKQVVKPARGNKKSDVERKRDGRAARRAIAKDRKNRPQDADDGEEFVSFSNQLQSLGLRLREIPGDGNCLFRALGDQLEGHSRGHIRLRQETVQYMKSHRHDFEPFVEDDVPFAEHLSNLSQPGTFAGNDAIVAFARSQELKVVIHQLNTPLWEINGVEKQACREMHIAYRYGDHYDSVRRVGDNSESPAQLRIENLHNADGQQREFGDGQMTAGESSPPLREDNVILSTYQHPAVHDRSTLLMRNTATIATQIQETRKRSTAHKHRGRRLNRKDDEEYLWQLSAATINAEWLAGPEPGQAPPPGSVSACRGTPTAGSDPQPPPEGNNAQKAKVSSKLRKEQQRLEKKKRQEERHRQKVLQGKGAPEHNQNLPEPVTLVPALNTLSI